MNQPLLTLLTLLLISVNSFSQEKSYSIPNSNFLKFIRDNRFNGVNIRLNPSKESQLIHLVGTKFEHYPQQYFIMHGEIYLYVVATGIVYTAIGDRYSDSIQFVRLDNTQHFGYNINSFQFSYQNRIFSIGGYGFWHWNGQLRVFSEKAHEWDLIPVNKEYPVAVDYPGSYFWMSEDQQKLYSFSFIFGNEVIKSPNESPITKIDSVLELNLQTLDWKTKGKLNDKLKDIIIFDNFHSTLDSGILIHHGSPKFFYLNLIGNRIDTLDNTDLYHFYTTITNDDVFWYKSGYCYKAKFGTAEIDSIKINPEDIKKGNDPIYIISNEKVFSSTYLYLLILVPVVLFFFRTKFYPKKSFASAPIEKDNSLISPYRGRDLFDEVEKSLIHLLFENAKVNGKRTGTDEINRILGVANKTIDMQKRKRSDVIKSINKKYQLIHSDNDKILIDRVKSEIDARLYEYVLNADSLDFIG